VASRLVILLLEYHMVFFLAPSLQKSANIEGDREREAGGAILLVTAQESLPLVLESPGSAH
jgi:hypothetical protein